MSERPGRRWAAAVQRFNRNAKLVGFARRTRERTLGDDDLIDHLSTARGRPSDLAARQLVALRGSEPGFAGEAIEPPVLERQGEVVKRLGDDLMAAFWDGSHAVEAAFAANERVAPIEVDGYRTGVHIGSPAQARRRLLRRRGRRRRPPRRRRQAGRDPGLRPHPADARPRGGGGEEAPLQRQGRAAGMAAYALSRT